MGKPTRKVVQASYSGKTLEKTMSVENPLAS